MADKVDLFKSSRLKQQSAFVLQHRAGAAVFVLFIRDAMLKDEFAQPSKTTELFILPRICRYVSQWYGGNTTVVSGLAGVYVCHGCF